MGRWEGERCGQAVAPRRVANEHAQHGFRVVGKSARPNSAMKAEANGWARSQNARSVGSPLTAYPMSIAVKSISSYLPIRARTNRTRSWMALRTPYRWSACATTATSPRPRRRARRVRRVYLDVDDRIGHLPLLPFSLVFSQEDTFLPSLPVFQGFLPLFAHSLRIPWVWQIQNAFRSDSKISSR
jgi:hypothetical protein